MHGFELLVVSAMCVALALWGGPCRAAAGEAWPQGAGPGNVQASLAAPTEAAPAETPSWQFDRRSTLQLQTESDQLLPATGRQHDERQAIEWRNTLDWQCEAGACAGAQVVLKPRLWLAHDDQPAGLPSRAPDALPEAWGRWSVNSTEFSLGRRLLGWGPSLLYSPTNRLFPDNGANTPRLQLPGKAMAGVESGCAQDCRWQVLWANPALQAAPDVQHKGGVGLARVAWSWSDPQPSELGAVVGGGGALRPWAGAYAQRSLDDAWTLGSEFSASRGYAKPLPAQPPLRQDDKRLRADATVDLRYGLASGGEVALEWITNAYALGAKEVQDPRLAAFPSMGDRLSRNQAIHPLTQPRYALLQGTWPKLFGDRRWSLTARVLRALAQPATDAFAELGWSPLESTTFFAGGSRSLTPGALVASRPVTASLYLAMEVHF